MYVTHTYHVRIIIMQGFMYNVCRTRNVRIVCQIDADADAEIHADADACVDVNVKTDVGATRASEYDANHTYVAPHQR